MHAAEGRGIARNRMTESPQVRKADPETGRYDGAATPGTGGDGLFEYYRRVTGGRDPVERGGYAVFRDGVIRARCPTVASAGLPPGRPKSRWKA